jgi:hypothetical protein
LSALGACAALLVGSMAAHAQNSAWPQAGERLAREKILAEACAVLKSLAEGAPMGPVQADPELAPHILETLKMQGVEQFGGFAIQIRLKMMTKPGEQFVIRRRALRDDQEGVRRQRYRVRLPYGHGRGRRRGARRNRPEGAGSRASAHASRLTEQSPPPGRLRRSLSEIRAGTGV